MARAAALIMQDGSIALIERRRRKELYYLFPGGQVEEGETIARTARREVAEELGLVVAIGRLIAEVTYKESVQYYFAAEITGGEFGTGSGNEMVGLAPSEHGTYTPVWLPAADLLRHPVYPRCVAEVVAAAATDGWPTHTLYLYDPGRA